MLWIVLGAATIAATPTQPLASAFERFCSPQDIPTQAILARADRDGWQSKGPGQPKPFDRATERFKPSDRGILELTVSDTQSAGEQRETCGVSVAAAAPGIVAATQRLLGFAPALNLGTAATFYALRRGDRWQSGAALNHADFLAAKSEGRFYTIVAATTGASSSIYALRVMPSAAVKGQP